MNERRNDKEWLDHLKRDEEFENKISRILFGENEEIGMKQKVDEMHSLLVQAQNVKGFFSSVGSFGKWIIAIAAMILVIKTWGASLLLWLHIK